MSKELIVSAGRHETRVAILEDDQVVELFHEREKEYSLAGSIHKGRVTRVLPGMQSAFVDIGLDRDAFLYVSDFFEDNDEYDAVVSTVEEKVLKMERGGNGRGPLLDANRDPNRQDKPAPERNGAATASEEPSKAEMFGVAPAGAAPTGIGVPGAEHRHEGGRDGRGDRGGRGRRGRRRRGGAAVACRIRSFFSPGSDVAGSPETESQKELEAEPAQAPSSRAFQADDDFMVLPGESLAKYSPEDTGSEVEEDIAEAPQVESALPGEHPLAGFGEVAAWVTSAPVEQPAEEERAVEEAYTPAPPESRPEFEPPPEEELKEEELKEEELKQVVTAIAAGDDEGLRSAVEVAEAEFAADVRAGEVFEDGGTPSEETLSEETVEEGPRSQRVFPPA